MDNDFINKVHQGNALDVLKIFPSDSIDLAVTSPPYYRQRKYGTILQVWDGDVLCAHEWVNSFCVKCVAWNGELGRENNVALYIKHLVDVFREVRRVLKPLGVFILNIADAYSKGTKSNISHAVPARIIIAMIDDGWVYRGENIWRKNCLPESIRGWIYKKHNLIVKKAEVPENHKRQQTEEMSNVHKIPPEYSDCPGCEKCTPNNGYVVRRGSWRPTRAHEYLIQFSKEQVHYGDGEAVKTPYKDSSVSRLLRGRSDSHKYLQTTEYGGGLSINAPRENITKEPDKDINRIGSGANLRSVLSFKHGGYRDSHYATFPVELPLTFIKAFTSEKGVCIKCGKPWIRIIRRDGGPTGGHRNRNDFKESAYDTGAHGASGSLTGKSLADVYKKHGYANIITLGWKQICNCENSTTVPCIVLDPFMGSGSTAFAAMSVGRSWIGIELNKKYIDLCNKRLGLFGFK